MDYGKDFAQQTPGEQHETANSLTYSSVFTEIRNE
jgi:hypothetical protein